MIADRFLTQPKQNGERLDALEKRVDSISESVEQCRRIQADHSVVMGSLRELSDIIVKRMAEQREQEKRSATRIEKAFDGLTEKVRAGNTTTFCGFGAIITIMLYYMVAF